MIKVHTSRSPNFDRYIWNNRNEDKVSEKPLPTAYVTNVEWHINNLNRFQASTTLVHTGDIKNLHLSSITRNSTVIEEGNYLHFMKQKFWTKLTFKRQDWFLINNCNYTRFYHIYRVNAFNTFINMCNCFVHLKGITKRSKSPGMLPVTKRATDYHVMTTSGAHSNWRPFVYLTFISIREIKGQKLIIWQEDGRFVERIVTTVIA